MSNRVPYCPPKFKADGFNCPHCHAFSNQQFGQPHFIGSNIPYGQNSRYFTSRCMRCSQYALWIDAEMVHPQILSAPLPNTDLPEDLKKDYQEARDILSRSPRGAAALLRLVIQKLCKELGQTGKNINNDIGTLVQNGLSPKIQQALDIVRVVGNDAVHPGKIDLNDDSETANQLFHIVNIVVETMISQPKQIENLFESIVPEEKKEQIAKRDGA